MEAEWLRRVVVALCVADGPALAEACVCPDDPPAAAGVTTRIVHDVGGSSIVWDTADLDADTCPAAGDRRPVVALGAGEILWRKQLTSAADFRCAIGEALEQVAVSVRPAPGERSELRILDA